MPLDATTSPADQLVDTALYHMAAAHPEAAIPHLEQALALDPDHAAATHALLRALEDTHQFEAALTLAHRRISADPDDVLAHTRLSILLQRLGRVPEAESAAARAKIVGWKHQLRTPPTTSL